MSHLLVPQVHLAEGADMTVRADEHGRVVERLPLALADAGRDVEPVVAREAGPGPRRLPVRDRLGEREGLVPALEHVAGVAQLRQDDQPGAVPRRLLDERGALLDVGGLLPDSRLHLDARDPDDGLVAALADLCHGVLPQAR
jgi:hypothetical protein